MKKFTDLSSPLSWLFFGLGTFLGLGFLFHPTILEFAAFVVVDTLFLAPAVAVNLFLFLKAYPEASLYFPDIQDSKIAALDTTKTKELLVSLFKFPERRARSVAIGSFIKVLLTSGLVVVFYWHHRGSYFLQFLKIALFESITMAYLFGASYIEFHDLVSRTVAGFHKKYNWSEAFESIDLPYPKTKKITPEGIAMVSVGVWSIALSALILLSETQDPNSSVIELAYKTIATSIIGLALFMRLYYLNRNHLRNGLEMIFNHFESFDLNNFDQVIPLHSSLVLARFERTFNQLTKRLRQREQEISEWIIFETEQSRIRALGEVSGLIAHDLSGPLHVVKFCSDELEEHLHDKKYHTFLKQLSFNTTRALDLVSSLKEYLRDSSVQSPRAIFNDCHVYVLQLLSMQFRKENILQTIKFENQEDLNKISLNIAKNDLVHILYNLYKNSIENLMTNHVTLPKISCKLHELAQSKLTIHISDNGTGLTEQRFEALTSIKTNATERNTFRGGLGLRLTRRLIERNRGELSVFKENTEAGAHFLLTLPILNLSELQTKMELQNEQKH